jgi:hypothetical protein
MPFRGLVIASLAILAVLTSSSSEALAQKPRKQPPVRTGLLQVKVAVDGATVAVDGTDAGVSPIAAPIRLTVGTHALKVSKDGYAEFLDTVKITTNQTTHIDVELLPFAAVVSVSSVPPGADVTIDGKLVGQTPLRTEVEAGQHELRLSTDGYHEASRPLTLQAGESYTVDEKLIALPPPPRLVVDDHRPIYKKWWFWAATGVVAVGATALVISAASSGDPLAGADRVIDVHF